VQPFGQKCLEGGEVMLKKTPQFTKKESDSGARRQKCSVCSVPSKPGEGPAPVVARKKGYPSPKTRKNPGTEQVPPNWGEKTYGKTASPGEKKKKKPLTNSPRRRKEPENKSPSRKGKKKGLTMGLGKIKSSRDLPHEKN